MFIKEIITLKRYLKLAPYAQVLNVICIHEHADFQRNFLSSKIPKNIKNYNKKPKFNV